MKIREIKKKDSLDIFLWRNDKVSIFFSKKKKKITLKNHNKWFERNLINTKKKSYIGFLVENNEKKKVGVVRFDIKKNYALVSINLNPNMRKKGLSGILLAEGIKKFFKFKKINLIAEINNKNLASINCFLKNKFNFLKLKDNYNIYQRTIKSVF